MRATFGTTATLETTAISKATAALGATTIPVGATNNRNALASSHRLAPTRAVHKANANDQLRHLATAPSIRAADHERVATTTAANRPTHGIRHAVTMGVRRKPTFGASRMATISVHRTPKIGVSRGPTMGVRHLPRTGISREPTIDAHRASTIDIRRVSTIDSHRNPTTGAHRVTTTAAARPRGLRARPLHRRDPVSRSVTRLVTGLMTRFAIHPASLFRVPLADPPVRRPAQRGIRNRIGGPIRQHRNGR